MLYEGHEMEPEQVIAAMQAELAKARPAKATLDKLAGNGKTRSRILGLMKEADPSLVIPEVDSKEEVLGEIKALRDQLEAEKKAAKDAEAAAAKERQENEAKSAIDNGRSFLRKRGYQDEGIEKVEGLMKDRNLPDYEAAALLFEKNQPKDEPMIPSNLGRSWDMFAPPEDDKNLQAAVSLPKGRGQHNALMRWQNNELSKTLQEIRGTR